MTAQRNRPTEVSGAAQELGRARHHDTATRPRTVAARLAAVDDTLEAVWTALASCALDLHRLREVNEHLFAIYMHGWDTGYGAAQERVRQAEHDSDRYYLRAMNEPARATEMQHRLDRQLASCPPHIEPHSPEYFEHVLRGAMIGGAA